MWKNFIFFAICIFVECSSNTEIFFLPDSLLDDVLLNATELIKKNGYEVEEHKVITEDKYILSIHRIPYGKKSENSHKTPVLVMHGFFSSSHDWIINGPGKSLGYILADAGYDVWMGNARGNYYSREHVTLDPDRDSDFWNFSWDEIGYYDLPAMITHILKTTGRRKLHYIGHSQGGTTFFAMASERPEYNENFLLMQGFAPAVFLSHSKSILYNLSPYANSIGAILNVLGINEFSLSAEVKKYIVENFRSKNSIFKIFYSNVLSILYGINPQHLNLTMIPVYLSRFPAGSSRRQMMHFGQLYLTGEFRKLDRGIWENIQSYGSLIPPKYNFKKITVPVAIYFGVNDIFVDPVDSMILYQKITNPVGFFKISKEFNHLDFLWAINAPTLVYEPALYLMNQFNHHKST